MKKGLFPGILAAAFLAFFIVPLSASAEVGKVLSVREKSKKVKIITLNITHYSSTDIGDIAGIKIHWATNPAFNNKRSKTVSVPTLVSNGKYDASSRKFTVKLKKLNGAKSYYVRVKLVGGDGSVSSSWKQPSGSAPIVTLPPKPKDLKVPAKKKTAMSVRLKWTHPRRCENIGCDYFVKIWKRSNKDLVGTKWAYNKNYVDFTSLAIGKKYYFRVQSCLTSTDCNAKFSDKKNFAR